MSGICDREQLRNISHFKVKALSMSARLSSGESQRWTGGWIRGGGEVFRARDFCRSGVSNRVATAPRASALPAAPTSCRLGLHTCLSAASYSGPAETHPTSSLSRVEMKPPTPTSPLRCSIELRAGSVQDLDQGFLAYLARAFGALRAAPLPPRAGERVTK